MGGAFPFLLFSHAWRGAGGGLWSERRFLRESDLALGWRDLQKGEQEPSLFTRAHLAGCQHTLEACLAEWLHGEGECSP